MKEVPNMWVGAVQYTQTNKHYCAANWFYCAQTPRVNSLLYECVYSGLYTVHCVLHALCTSPPSPVSCRDERRGGGARLSMRMRRPTVGEAAFLNTAVGEHDEGEF